MATTPTTALSMKLLVDTRARRVLLAEASKEVIDFLFSLLSLPVGTFVKILQEDSSIVGCVGCLYDSAVKLKGADVQAGDALLHPSALSPASSSFHSTPAQPKTFYRCNSGSQDTCRSCRGYVTAAYGTACPSCYIQMTTELMLVPSTESRSQVAQEAAVVNDKGVVAAYTVMDDLAVRPMSSISNIKLLNSFAVKDLAVLQEKTVEIGYSEGLEILKASLRSKTVLTDVFLGKKPAPGTWMMAELYRQLPWFGSSSEPVPVGAAVGMKGKSAGEGLEILKASLQSKNDLTDVFLGKKGRFCRCHMDMGK